MSALVRIARMWMPWMMEKKKGELDKEKRMVDMKKLMRMIVAFSCIFLVNFCFAGNTEKEIENKKVVQTFYDAVINKKDFDAASKFLGPYYRQHSPLAADGAQGLKNFIAYLKKNFPNAHNDIKQIFSDGDYVILHVHAIRIPGTRGRVNFDLFKLDHGKIIEHWDAIQEIPEKSLNNNGMF